MSEKNLEEEAENWYEELAATVGLFTESLGRYNNPKYTYDGTTPEKMLSQDDFMMISIKKGIEIITEAVLAGNKDIAKKVLNKTGVSIGILKSSRSKYKESLDKTKIDELSFVETELERQEGHIKSVLK